LTPSDFNFATNGTFFFSYVLMNSRILTETFNNILTSQINAERASIRIHSTIDVLKAYFLNHSPIEVINFFLF
jgi:DNA-binding SARP family transcriptional activator